MSFLSDVFVIISKYLWLLKPICGPFLRPLSSAVLECTIRRVVVTFTLVFVDLTFVAEVER